ncbi:MAG: DNA translocase FtsK [Acidobacteria bacterium]|nr:DNA translocase FtsK [Acidobacteriota bacterium]
MSTVIDNSLDRSQSPSRVNEIIGIALLAFSLAIMLSLFSYDPQDPAWNVVSTREQAVNWIGTFGAWIADFLFQIFGLSAFLVPILITSVGWRTLRFREIKLIHRRFIGVVILLVSLASLLSLPEMPFYRENVQFGGAIGILIAQLLETQLNKTGTGIALIVLLVFSVMLITELSVNAILESSGVKTILGGFRTMQLVLSQKITALHLSWQEHLKARKQAKQEKEFLRQRLREEEAVKREKERTARLKEEKLAKTNIETSKLESNKKVSGQVAPTDRVNKTISNDKFIPENEKDTPTSANALVVGQSNQAILGKALVKPNPNQLNSAVSKAVQANQLEPPVLPGAGFLLGNKKQASLDELHKLVYGEDHPTDTLEEFSLSGALPSLPPTDFDQKIPSVLKQEPVIVLNPVIKGGSATAKVNSPRIAQSMRETAASIPVNQLQKTYINQEDNLVDGIVINRQINTDEQVSPVVAKSNTSFSSLLMREFELPSVEFLAAPAPKQVQADEELRERAKLLVDKYKEFSVTGEVQAINPGPVVTTFEFKPDPGVKYSRITSLTDDLCLALEAESVRIDRIPGKSTVGIEVPNSNREKIFIREIFESEKFQSISSPLTLALGKSIDGRTYAADLTKMPHLLIAGATGTGKSVCLNSLIVSILYKASPDDVKMIMVDPKRLELGLYEGIPHLLTPIVLEPKRASNALKWAVGEMERRYKLLAGYSVRNIDQYNQQVRQEHEFIPAIHPDRLRKPLPYIVIIIDELADLMMVASSDVETSITRLAQMARAVGIHLVIATQRPSVDVITGLIKANFPSRISFRVSSKVDSRTILDTNGAETLLGQGDMLFLPPGTSRLVRVHGAYVGEKEIENIVEHIRNQRQPDYDTSIQSSDEDGDLLEGSMEKDELFDEAIKVVCQMGKASTSVLQRRLRIGYGRAAAIIDMMEREGYVGTADGSKPRVVKQSAYDYFERLEQMKEE